MAVRIQLRRDTAANWVSSNPTLRAGEIGIETDTLKFKVGNGSSPWNSITAYANVVPADLNTTLNGYLEVGDLSNTVAEIVDGAVYVPGTNIVFEGTANAHELTLAAPDVTSDKTITLPDATTTLVGTDVAQTLTNKTLTSPVVSGLSLSDSSIVFEGAVADSYETTLTVGEPTADRTITLPDVTGTVVTTGDTGSVTNAMLAGSIANNKLSNSSVTINGYEIALGSSATYGTDNINEGTSNLYFTNERAQDAVATALSNGTHTNITVSYDDNANTISLTGAQTYNDENARDAVSSLITNSTHDGVSVAYTDSGASEGTLVFTNTDKGSSQNIFKNIVVGATTVVADGNNDTLTFVGSNGVGALANATNDVIEFYNTGVTSISGTSNEVEVDTSTGAVIVGLPNNVTIGGYLTLSNTPTQASHAATKAYVDNTTAGLNFHAPAHAATTANLSATYANGTGGVGATLTSSSNGALVIDGHTLSADERVLVKNQSTGFQNGLYTVTATGDGSNPWVLTRATDADNSPAGEVAYGDFCFVQNGSTNAGFGFIVNTTGTITLGTTAISYVQFNAGQTVIAGNGLTESSPGTLAIDTAVTADVSTSQTFTNKTISGSSNTLSNIGNSSLTNSKVTIGSTDINLGSTATTLAGLSSVTSTSFVGALTGNADTVTNGVVTTGSYSNPSWITSLGWSKISSTPTTISGYGITNAVVTDAANTITAASASTKPLIIKAAASQSANLQEWQNSSGTVLATIDSNGNLKTEYLLDRANGGSYIQLQSNNAVLLSTRSSTNKGLLIQGVASQSANLQEWQNSSGTVLANIDSSGNFVIGRSGSGSLGNGLITLQGVTAQSFYSNDNTSALHSRILFLRGNTTGSIMSITSKGDTSQGVAALVITNGGFSTEITGFGYNGNIYTNLQSATAVGLTIKAASSQSASIQEWQNSSNGVLAKIASDGSLWAYNNILTGRYLQGTNQSEPYLDFDSNKLTVNSRNASYVGLVVKGVASQSANLQEWQNSSGTVLASVNASGQFVGDGSQLTGLTTALTTPSTVTLSANTATTVDTTALSGFTSIEYMVSLKQGSKVRTSKVVLQTDGTSVDMTEFAITETGGTMSGVVISATTASTNAVLQATVTDASSTNVTVKLAKIKL